MKKSNCDELDQVGLTLSIQFWDEIKGSDGIVRQLQWTARVEGNDAITASKREWLASLFYL